MKKAWDLIVVGGGPAGSTLAGLVKKLMPGRRVLLLERETGPRHHVGESLLPGLVPVLKELGAYEKIDGAGFPRKLGATYVWGADRTPWENDFNDVNIEVMLERYGKLPERIEYAWQVVRSKYDEILLTHAQELGAEVRRGARVSGIIEQADGRITGVTLSTGETLSAEFVADCSGQDGFLSKFRKIREYNPALRNVAGYAYFKNAKWKYSYTGHPDKTKIFIATIGHGWFWYIPVSADVISVGLVTTVEHLKRAGEKDLRALFLRELRACEELWPLVEHAEMLDGFDGAEGDFQTHKDWSYLTREAAGPGWLAVGDAAVFVDPILSSGVTLAQLSAHRAAYTLATWWSDADSSVRDLLWDDYSRFCRESAEQYFVLALFWYGNDPHAESWWAKAAKLQRAWLPVPLTDKGAFVTVSAGLTQYYDRLFSLEALFDEATNEPEEFPFFMSVFPKEGKAGSGAPSAGDVLRLTCPFETEYVFLPEPGKARLRPAKRARFLRETGTEELADAFNPRKIVTRHHLSLLEALDGRRTFAEALEILARAGVPKWWLEGPAWRFALDLRIQGVLEPAAAQAAR